MEKKQMGHQSGTIAHCESPIISEVKHTVKTIALIVDALENGWGYWLTNNHIKTLNVASAIKNGLVCVHNPLGTEDIWPIALKATLLAQNAPLYDWKAISLHETLKEQTEILLKQLNK